MLCDENEKHSPRLRTISTQNIKQNNFHFTPLRLEFSQVVSICMCGLGMGVGCIFCKYISKDEQATFIINFFFLKQNLIWSKIICIEKSFIFT